MKIEVNENAKEVFGSIVFGSVVMAAIAGAAVVWVWNDRTWEQNQAKRLEAGYIEATCESINAAGPVQQSLVEQVTLALEDSCTPMIVNINARR